MIGPRGAGKSTISSVIINVLHMPKISLDNREQLKNYYNKLKYIRDPKDYEFFLTSSVLSNLAKPAIIAFSAGHLVYENQIMFYELKKLISRFSNVVYLLPSENKEESITILNQRVKARKSSKPELPLSSKEFFDCMTCNDILSTIKIYTKDKEFENICKEIIIKKKKKIKLKQIIQWEYILKCRWI